MKAFKTHRKNISLLMYYRGRRMGLVYGLCVLMLVALPLFSVATKNYSYYLSGYYNEFILQPLCSITFPAIFLIWLIYSVYDLRRLNWKYNIRDRQWILPCSHVDVILSDILFLIVSIFGIMLIETIVYYLGNQVYTWRIGGELLHNEFFLSVTRSFYTSFFIALSPADLLKMLLHVSVISMLCTHFGRWHLRAHKLVTALFICFILQFVIYTALTVFTILLTHDGTGSTFGVLDRFFEIYAYYFYKERYIFSEIAILLISGFTIRNNLKKNQW